MNALIFNNGIQVHNIEELSNTIKIVLDKQSFIRNLCSNYNWTNSSIEDIANTIKNYLRSLEEIKI